jgi:hypothetical protein
MSNEEALLSICRWEWRQRRTADAWGSVSGYLDGSHSAVHGVPAAGWLDLANFPGPGR